MKNVLASFPPSQSSIQHYYFLTWVPTHPPKKKKETDRLTMPQAMFKNLILKLSINPYALGKTGSNPNGTVLQAMNHQSPSTNTQEWKTTDLRPECF